MDISSQVHPQLWEPIRSDYNQDIHITPCDRGRIIVVHSRIGEPPYRSIPYNNIIYYDTPFHSVHWPLNNSIFLHLVAVNEWRWKQHHIAETRRPNRWHDDLKKTSCLPLVLKRINITNYLLFCCYLNSNFVCVLCISYIVL